MRPLEPFNTVRRFILVLSKSYHAAFSTSPWNAMAIYCAKVPSYLSTLIIIMIGGTKRDVIVALSAIERESADVMGLIGPQIMSDNYKLNFVKQFVYLNFAVTSKYYVSLEIQRKITSVNRLKLSLYKSFCALIWFRSINTVKIRCSCPRIIWEKNSV